MTKARSSDRALSGNCVGDLEDDGVNIGVLIFKVTEGTH
jgi:hypothetical protein